MAFRAGLLILAGLLLGGAPALAQSEPRIHQWRVVEECPEREVVEAEIERLLGASGPPSRSALGAVGVIERTGDRFALTLTLRDGESPIGTRELAGGDCAALAEAAALLVALAVDPGAVASGGGSPSLPGDVAMGGVVGEGAREDGGRLDSPLARSPGREPPLARAEAGSPTGTAAPAAPEPAADTPGATEAEPLADSPAGDGGGALGRVLTSRLVEPGREPAPVTDRAGSPRRWPLRFAFDLRTGLELGVLPAPAGSVRAGLVLARRRLRIGVAAEGFFPRTESVPRPGLPTAEARFFGLGARLEVGGGAAFGRALFEGAAVGALDALGGRAVGVSDPARGSAPLLTVGALVRVLIDLGRLRLGIEGDLRLAVDAPIYRIAGLDWSHRPASVVGQVGLMGRFGPTAPRESPEAGTFVGEP